jgi:hypothetical protein
VCCFGIYQTEAGLETRAGYVDDSLRSQFTRDIGGPRELAWLVEDSSTREGLFGLTN